MVEIRDVTVASEIFAATFFTLHYKVTKLLVVKIALEEWDEDDSAVLSKDDNSSLLKPTCPFSYFRLKKWSNLKSNKRRECWKYENATWCQVLLNYMGRKG